MREVIKHINQYVLVRRIETKYFKNGRANLHCQVTYSVEFYGSPWPFNQRLCYHLNSDKYSFTNKTKALQYLKEVTKSVNKHGAIYKPEGVN